jgi:hypothetical protein
MMARRSTGESTSATTARKVSPWSLPSKLKPYAAAMLEFMRASGEPTSNDADVNYARELAARFTMIAAEIEAGAGADDSKRSREIVRRVRRSIERVDSDEWIALEKVIISIEAAAGHSSSDTLTVARLADASATRIHESLLKTYPAVAERVTTPTIRAAIEAARDPKRGASKWLKFVPIAKAIVGVDSAEELRKVLSRNRRRRIGPPHK